MERQHVSSSNVTSIGWEATDGQRNVGTLEVEFKRGGVYQYADVPYSVYLELQGTSSVGRFLRENVIGIYEHTRQ